MTDVEAAIRTRLALGTLSLRAVAGDLRVTPRTLQRRLTEIGQSYSVLVHRVRTRIACTMLRDRTLKIAQIGHRLGFADPSNFSRAFRGWTGATPLQWRNRYNEMFVETTGDFPGLTRLG